MSRLFQLIDSDDENLALFMCSVNENIVPDIEIEKLLNTTDAFYYCYEDENEVDMEGFKKELEKLHLERVYVSNIYVK